ncbi:hypothetical protein PE066_16105 [Ramlibacter tataouinensis]|uniref:hypothetical protein n=1 Tax=Ramlibacter tataouinensis TaxID=94132 RepID=UPI0022F388D4|nr:hypothetical protein [Ramlibacter tataouinensis]WBY00975.1 hypothetical protein PE066_16105 [Ramlibacter tataouinensis]
MDKRRVNAAVLAALLAATMGAGPVWADKPEWAGHGNGHKSGDSKHKHKHKDNDRKRDRREARVGGYFDERDRRSAHAWYGDHYGGRKGCPPGLGKKNNGCLPPGQAKKYAVGQPLPAGVVMYPVPAAVVVQLPPAPHGHKYVRVAADILLIAVGTSMVVDAITDLGRL